MWGKKRQIWIDIWPGDNRISQMFECVSSAISVTMVADESNNTAQYSNISKRQDFSCQLGFFTIGIHYYIISLLVILSIKDNVIHG